MKKQKLINLLGLLLALLIGVISVFFGGLNFLSESNVHPNINPQEPECNVEELVDIYSDIMQRLDTIDIIYSYFLDKAGESRLKEGNNKLSNDKPLSNINHFNNDINYHLKSITLLGDTLLTYFNNWHCSKLSYKKKLGTTISQFKYVLSDFNYPSDFGTARDLGYELEHLLFQTL